MNEAPWVALNRQYLIDYYPLSLALEITRKVSPDWKQSFCRDGPCLTHRFAALWLRFWSAVAELPLPLKFNLFLWTVTGGTAYRRCFASRNVIASR